MIVFIPFPRAGQEHNAVDIMMEEITLAYTMLAPFVAPSEAVTGQMQSRFDRERAELELESAWAAGGEGKKKKKTVNLDGDGDIAKKRTPTFKSAMSFKSWRSAKQKNRELLDKLRHLTMLDTKVEPQQSETDLSCDEYVSPWPLLLQATYRATRHTARSKQWHRQIAFLSLLIESVDESCVAIRSYVDSEHLLDKQDQQQPEGTGGVGVGSDGPAKSPASGGGSVDTASSERYENDRDENIAILLAGSRLLAKVQQTQQALLYAERAVDQCRIYWSTKGRQWISEALLVLGMCYLQLGMETLEHELYVQFQEQAIIMLRESERWDVENWRLVYCLGYALAITGKVCLDCSFVSPWFEFIHQHVDRRTRRSNITSTAWN